MKPPLLKKGGVIQRADFANYLRTLAPHLGFHLDSPDFASVRDTGDGLHITRRKEKLITLELELQARWATAFTCYREVISDVVYTTLTLVEVYENGSITETQTAAGGVHVHTPSDASYTCPEVDVSSDFDDEFDYGAFVETEDPVYSGVFDPATLLPAAAAALEDDGSPTIAQSWSWLSNAAAPTGITQVLGAWTGATDPLVGRRIDSVRYRWKVTGRSLDIAWDQGGGSFAITVAPGTPSSWYDDVIPATQSVHDEITNVVIALA